MDRLWSPWRSKYIQSIDSDGESPECVFCAAVASSDDDERYLLRRHARCATLLNLYPYNSGHLLIVPYAHACDLLALDEDTYVEMTGLIREWMATLNDVMRPQGFNIGSNIGRVAGAGIDRHVHIHIVPRWSGDINFMPVIGETKVISESMTETMHKLRLRFDERRGGAPA